MAGLRVNVYDSKELKALIQVAKSLPKEVNKAVRQETKKMIQPAWKQAVLGHAETALEVKVLAETARVAVSDQNVTLSSATIGKALKGGGKPPDLYVGAEFGSVRFKQFKRRNRKGYVVYEAAAEVIPRLIALWVQTAVRTIHEQIESKE